jgi:glycosyltransferase involved in cell wall biosynthesis
VRADRRGAPAASVDEGAHERGPLRIAVVGVSLSPTCGVRDHAGLLAAELERGGASCSLHWLRRDGGSFGSERAQLRGWARELTAELSEASPDVVVLHYSVFSYSYKGVPLFVAPVLAALRAAGFPLVSIMHEYVYRWNYGGWRGKVWALTQRMLLVEVIRASSAVIVTAEVRARWLASRPWLPRRPTLLAPVFSNLPAPLAPAPAPRELPVLGIFGYAYQGAAVDLVLDAVGALRRRGVEVALMLLGAPGASSPPGQMWLEGSRRRGLQESLSFSGRLPAQELSDALAGCDVLLFADTGGPTSRKGTLAGSLASGRPLVAIDGPQAWPALLDAGALRVARPNPDALADAVAELLADADAREALGSRGRAFAEGEMGIARTAAAVTKAAAAVLGRTRA